MSRVSYERSATKGLTLVEVVAGIALLSTLLVSILMAFRTHADQVRGAQDRLAAIEAAEGLLSQWFADAVLPAVGNQGVLPDNNELFWRIVAGETSSNQGLGIQVIRLEIVRRGAGTPDEVLTSVELLAHASGVILQ